MMRQRVLKGFSPQAYGGILLMMVFFLANRRAFVCWYINSFDYYCEYGNALADYLMWGMVVLVALLLTLMQGKSSEYWLAWKANWPLGLFLLYSIASVSWSIAADRSIHTVYIMVMASLAGTFLAILLPKEQLLRTTLLFLAIAACLSLALVVFFPGYGVHQEAYLARSWRGILTHKNYLGSMMALANGLSLVALALLPGKREFLLKIFFYLFTLFLIVMSRSATGFILWAALNGVCLLFLLWKKWHAKLQQRNYLLPVGLILALVFLGSAAALIVFSFLGKNLNLTGRVPLWQLLIDNIVSQKPWFGYGLETLWYVQSFQIWAGKTAGWGIVVVNGHSGYMDILLYLGLVGLALLCFVLVRGLVYTLRGALDSQAWLDFYPLLMLVYVLIVNIAISYFLEFESFHWFLLILVLFLPHSRNPVEIPAAK